LKLNKLRLHKINLNPENPIFEWPKVRVKHYEHIDNIKVYPNMTIYDIKLSLIESKEIEEETLTDNIVLQYIQSNYFLLYTSGEPHHDNNLIVKPIKAKQFLSIINLRKMNYKSIKDDISNVVPQTNDDLYETDND
jgi:hypothetical protein